MKNLILLSCLLSLLSCSYITPNKFSDNQRSPGTKVDDSIIRNNILKQIRTHSLNKKNHINVSVFNHTVLLSGEVETNKIKQQVEQLSSTIYKVRKTHNVLNVSAPSSFLARSSDGVITSSVKAQLFRYPDTRSSRTKIVTERGVVYLMGLVSQKEAKRIVTLASSVRGVQKIVKLFEIIQP